MKKRINKRKCLHCREWFRPKRWGNAKTCGARCARKRWDKKNPGRRVEYNRRAYLKRIAPGEILRERIEEERPVEDVRMPQEAIREVEAGQETGDMPVERTSVLGRLLSRREG